jgi:hypothetical protein
VWVLCWELVDISPGDAMFYNMNDSVEGTWTTSSAGAGTMVVTIPSQEGDNSNSDNTQGNTGIVLVVSGSYPAEVNHPNDVGKADGEYTLVDSTATGTSRVWQNSNGYSIMYFQPVGGWIIETSGNLSNPQYDHYNMYTEPTAEDGSTAEWWYQGGGCSMTVTQKA